MAVDIKSTRSEFKYKSKWWRIQLWKGRYGLTNGGEIGIYTGNKKKGWYRCAKTGDMLKMNISLKNKGKTLFSRSSGSGTHWWLNGFKPGKKISKSNLKIVGTITFKSKSMADKFRKGAGSALKTKKKSSKKVSIEWQ